MKSLFDLYSRKVAVIMPTLKCNASCSHCILSCSPERNETMPDELLEKCTREFLELGFSPICLTGGEVFLFPRKVRIVAKLVREYAAALVIQTNGSWAGTPAAARQILASMPGITQLGFSVDDAHQQFIPRERICNGIEAAHSLGIENLSLSITYRTIAERREIEQYFGRRFPSLAITSWPVTPLGRAAANCYGQSEWAIHDWCHLPRGCEAQKTFTPLVTPEGDLHLCYHLIMLLGRRDPFFVGNLAEDSLRVLLRAGDTPLYRFILAYGAGSLGHLVREICPDLLQLTYQRTCSFCYAALSRPDVVDALKRVLARKEFAQRTTEALVDMFAPQTQTPGEKPETLVLCVGKNCFKKETNENLRFYLVNRLIDSGKYARVGIECIDCFGRCKEAPNAKMKERDSFFHRLDSPAIDTLIDAI